MNNYAFWFNVPKDTPTTGVVSCHSLEWIYEETDGDGINISMQDAWAYRLQEQTNAWQAEQEDPDAEPGEELIEEWSNAFYEEYEEQGDRYIVGDWLTGDDGKFFADPALPKDGFAAIVDYDTNNVQVVLSRWVTRSHYCSPCYPNQCDLDTPGDYLGYDFPAEMYGDNRRNPNPVEEYTPSAEAADHAE